MNYRKLINNAIHLKKDNSLPAFALIAGLAVGAAVAVLFAPRSGRESRKVFTRRLLSSNKKTDQQELEDHLINDLRETTRNHATRLQGPENKRKDPSKIKVPSAGTSAWKAQSIEE